MPAKFLFKEEQKFGKHLWFWAVMSAIGALVLVHVLELYNKGEERSATIQLILFVAVLGFMLMMKLKLVITENSISYSFFPLVKKKELPWSEVEFAQIVTYSPLVGYGIRFTFSFGRMYNISGRKALLIQPKKGRKFSIGTQKAGELDAALEQLFTKQKKHSRS